VLDETKVGGGFISRLEKELTAKVFYSRVPGIQGSLRDRRHGEQQLGGEKTLAYGKTEDYVQGLNIVMSDGHSTRLAASGESFKPVERKKFRRRYFWKIIYSYRR